MPNIIKLIEKLCPNGVEYKNIGDLITIEKGKQLNKTLLSDEGEYPVINGGIMPSGYWNEYNYDEDLITISQGGASAGYVNYIDTKFWAGAHCYVVTKVNNEINYRYVYHFLKSKEVELQNSQVGAGIPSVSLKDIKDLKIAVPPLEVQCEIVHILDDFTLLSAALSAELEARQKQYEYYRGQLIHSEKENFQKLGTLCNIYTGGEAPDDCIKGNKSDEAHPYAVWGNGKEIYGYSSKYRIDKDAVVISSIGANTGSVYYRKAFFTPIIRLKVIIPKDNTILDSRYLFHALSSTKIESKSSSVPNMNANEIKALTIPVPNIEKQKQIANILDAFDRIINDISVGLPAEIEARQKQYEYYRDKLLTFKELVNEG